MSIDIYSTARAMAAAIGSRDISARELLDLHLDRIEAVNPQVNAVVSLDPERAREQATAADEATARGEATGPLHGLPFAFKDTHEVAGWRTTYGSPLMADHVADGDDLVVERVRAAGVVVIGKTNVPEWAAGSHTFNPIFGKTLNPYDLTRSAGGSSGGAAAALVSGMVPLADGSDMGGSLRNPASFCNVVGLRPSLGRVPDWPADNAWETTSVAGPMARNVEDLALLLSVMAGPDPRTPQALETPGSTFAAPRQGDLRGVRVALSADLGGAFAVDDAVAGIVESQADVFTDSGATVTRAHPDLGSAMRSAVTRPELVPEPPGPEDGDEQGHGHGADHEVEREEGDGDEVDPGAADQRHGGVQHTVHDRRDERCPPDVGTFHGAAPP
jgi:amidase